jgi:hypothetical protein
MEPKDHYRVHKDPPPNPILIQKDPVHTLPAHFFENHIHIIRPSTPRSYKCSLPSRFSDQNPYTYLISPMRTTCPAHPILHSIILYGEE